MMVYANLNSPVSDESFGIDNVTISETSTCGGGIADFGKCISFANGNNK
jgi:hypothetical protein